MSLISFLKDAGEKLFPAAFANEAPAQPSAPAATPASAPKADIAQLNATAAEAIKRYVATQNLSAKNLDIQFDGATQTVTVRGTAPDQATREKIVLACGNVNGVAEVDDQMTVEGGSSTASKFHTVKSGDTLSKIAKQAYGDANAYMKIFEANRPMLSDPDKIYPGQNLRIPAA